MKTKLINFNDGDHTWVVDIDSAIEISWLGSQVKDWDFAEYGGKGREPIGIEIKCQEYDAHLWQETYEHLTNVRARMNRGEK